jgi:Uma2 family endonuclease
MVSKTSTPQTPFGEDEVDDLTIDYPSSDGEPMAENDWQYIALTDTVSTLRVRYQGRDDVYVAGDMLIYYRMNRNDVRVAPDVFVVFGATGNYPRDSWLVWREGRAPDFIMEVASPSTWRRDATEKRRIYADMGVTEYARFDPTGDHFMPALVMETLDGANYREQPLETDDDGNLRGHSGVLGLDICVTPDLELRLYDPAADEWLLTHQETEEARRESEEARRESEEARRESEEARRAAEAEIERLRSELRRLQQP